MSIYIKSALILNEPAPFDSKFFIQIHLICEMQVEEDILWRAVYSCKCKHGRKHVLYLDKILTFPVPIGVFTYTFEIAAPDTSKFPPCVILDLNWLTITGDYDCKTFVKMNFEVKNFYLDPKFKEHSSETPVYEKLYKQIVSNTVKGSVYNIKWMKELKQEPEF